MHERPPISTTYEDYLKHLVVERLKQVVIGIFLLVVSLAVLSGLLFPDWLVPMLAFAVLGAVLVPILSVVLRLSWFERNIVAIMLVFQTVTITLVLGGFHYFGLPPSDVLYLVMLIAIYFIIGSVLPFKLPVVIYHGVHGITVYAVIIFLADSSFFEQSILTNLVVSTLFLVAVLYVNILTSEVREKEFEARHALSEERRKSESLLHNIIPPSIAVRLKNNERVADRIGEATVLFADLVGFTQLSSTMLPSKVVEIIEDIFSRFDDVMDKHGLEKIKTVGDEYMAVAGVPTETDDHALAAVAAALDMVKALESFNKENGESLNIRVGVHSGPLVAGVIGTKKMSYDVWGDTVNTASRMESHSENGRIQISEVTYHFIKNKFQSEYRGEIEVKGKGLMKTYYLSGAK